MSHLTLVRSARDRRVYELAGVGTLWVAGWLGGDRAIFTTNNGTWHCDKATMIGGSFNATGSTGTVDGRFAPGLLGASGSMSWAGVQYALGPAGGFATGYRLDRGHRTVCEFGIARLFGERRPIDVSRRNPELPDEALLFAVAIVRKSALEAARKKSRRRTSRSALAVMLSGR